MTKADIIAGLRKQPIPFSVDGIDLLLKPWTAAARLDFFAWRQANPGAAKGLFQTLARLSICGPDGVLTFSDSPEDLQALSDLDGLALEKIGERILELNGLDSKKADSTVGPN